MLIVIKTLAITSFESQQEEWVSSTLYTKRRKMTQGDEVTSPYQWQSRDSNNVCLT